MTEFQRYLAEEVAEDHADGLVSRREALRRLGLLGLGGAAAASLLAGALADQARALTRVAAGPGRRGRRAAQVDAAALPTREITFRGPQGRRLIGAWAAARRPRGGVLVIHENRGLNDSIRTVAGRLAASGYSALAIDLLSEEGGTKVVRGRVRSDGGARSGPTVAVRGRHEGGGDGASAPRPGEEGRRHRVLLRRRHDLAPARLEGASPGGRRPVLRPLPRQREPRGRQGGRARGLRGARLEGQRDPHHGPCRSAKAGLRHQIVTYPGVDHAFFNPTSSRYNAAAATAAYRRMLTWFGTYVAS